MELQKLAEMAEKETGEAQDKYVYVANFSTQYFIKVMVYTPPLKIILTCMNGYIASYHRYI